MLAPLYKDAGVPEVAVDEHGDTRATKNDVRSTGQIANLKPIAQSPAEEQAAQEYLRRIIAAAYGSHDSGSSRNISWCVRLTRLGQLSLLFEQRLALSRIALAASVCTLVAADHNTSGTPAESFIGAR